MQRRISDFVQHGAVRPFQDIPDAWASGNDRRLHLVHGFLERRPLLLAVSLGDLRHLAAVVHLVVVVEQLAHHMAREQLAGETA